MSAQPEHPPFHHAAIGVGAGIQPALAVAEQLEVGDMRRVQRGACLAAAGREASWGGSDRRMPRQKDGTGCQRMARATGSKAARLRRAPKAESIWDGCPNL